MLFFFSSSQSPLPQIGRGDFEKWYLEK